jgi:hypothetical protein
MSPTGMVPGDSPIQQHRVFAANDLQWIDGLLTTLGNPTNYINQDDLEFLTVTEPGIAPWSFTGLPNSRPSEVVMVRERLHLMVFPDDATTAQFREAPHTEILLINLGIAIVRGKAPFLSEAKLSNFLDFWKGMFFPITDARVHFLSSCATELPTHAGLLYANRRMVQSYTHA